MWRRARWAARARSTRAARSRSGTRWLATRARRAVRSEAGGADAMQGAAGGTCAVNTGAALGGAGGTCAERGAVVGDASAARGAQRGGRHGAMQGAAGGTCAGNTGAALGGAGGTCAARGVVVGDASAVCSEAGGTFAMQGAAGGACAGNTGAALGGACSTCAARGVVVGDASAVRDAQRGGRHGTDAGRREADSMGTIRCRARRASRWRKARAWLWLYL
jgi:hypothetical protein